MRAITRGITSDTNRLSSLSRNERHFMYSELSKILARSRGLDSSV